MFHSILLKPNRTLKVPVILKMFFILYKNNFIENIEDVQNSDQLERKPRSFYNYIHFILLSKKILGNIRKIGSKTIKYIATSKKFKIFRKAVNGGRDGVILFGLRTPLKCSIWY